MQLLSPGQCPEWLAARHLGESPYGKPLQSGTFYEQFNIARCSPAARVAIREVSVASLSEQGNLVQVMDWSPFEGNVLPASLSALWATHGEPSTFWRGGMTFASGESAALEECCLHIHEQGMSAYLYSVEPRVTFYFWEGELLDFWSSSKAIFESVRSSLARAGARSTGRDDG